MLNKIMDKVYKEPKDIFRLENLAALYIACFAGNLRFYTDCVGVCVCVCTLCKIFCLFNLIINEEEFTKWIL